MSIIEAAPDESGSDAEAIASLRAAFEAQSNTFGQNRNPDIAARRDRIEALITMMLSNRTSIAEALSADFGSHPKGASDLIEVLGVLGRAQYVLEHLEEWMQPRPRDADPAVFGTARAYVQSQPKGVIGNMVPWNFPFDLSVGPLIEMLAAGNRVIIKPSEYTPVCAKLLARMVAATFDPALVYVAVGGRALSESFAGLPWNHLLYTGSPEVGRQVMAAAARNLTPVTLELGGKCPAIMIPGSVTPTNVEAIIGCKTIKNGQMCVSVDYALVPRAEIEAFADHAVDYMARRAPDYSRTDDCTGIISSRHLDRLEQMLKEASERQTRIVPLEADGQIDREHRRMPLSLVLDPESDLRLMREEIFGPILPVVPYDDLESAVEMVNSAERPLGIYVFGEDEELVARIVNSTSSGGVSVNACAAQSALPSLGFGGVGMSGMGRHHGEDGFREFSNERGVVVRGTGDLIDAFSAPYAQAEAIADAALSGR